MTTIKLSTQFPSELIGLTAEPVQLSWIISGAPAGSSQLGYRIEASGDSAFESKVDSVESRGDEQIEITAPGERFDSREIRYYRAQVELNTGWSTWSNVVRHEVGLVDAREILALAISDGSRVGAPVALFRKTFDIAEPIRKARLYLSGQGLVDGHINGKSVSEEFLNPGWTAYQERISIATYDVTGMLVTGDNCIAFEVADGWYRGRFGFMNMTNNYGEQSSVIAQLEIESVSGQRIAIVTDEGFKTSTAELISSCIYDGAKTDFRCAKSGWQLAGYDDSDWQAIQKVDFDKALLMPRFAEPIRKIASFPMRLVSKTERQVFDAGQNISGWVKLRVIGKAGDKVIVRHAEILNNSGQLHVKPLRMAKATDEYILAVDGEQLLEPRFTFHGFQFADVDTKAEVLSAEAIAISSDLPSRSDFECSHAGLNRLHQNVYWSLRDNYVGLPTDCPQRDERMGWTGDAQAFAMTAATMVQQLAFIRSWLLDMRLDQAENGDIPVVVPDLMRYQPSPAPGGVKIEGMAGWGDAVTVVPWAQYQAFGSLEVLREQRPAMERWISFCESRREGAELLPPGFQLGDWLDPDAPEGQPAAAKVSGNFVANAFFAHSTALTAKTLVLLGDESAAKQYFELHEELKLAIWRDLADAARKTPTGCSMLLEFDIAPEDQRAQIASELSEMVRASEGMIATGFLGTPLILHALSKNGHIDEAYLMLLRTKVRSWLYQVERGATTIWERWDAIGPNGEINDGELEVVDEEQRQSQEDHSMISFNHYAYGAVVDWMYQNVLGIGTQMNHPGYRQFSLQPRPTKLVTCAKGRIRSPFGNIEVDWSLKGKDLFIELQVPFGSSAYLDLPVGPLSTIVVNGQASLNQTILPWGSHSILLKDFEEN